MLEQMLNKFSASLDDALLAYMKGAPRSSMNSVLVRFNGGACHVVSRFAVRKLK